MRLRSWWPLALVLTLTAAVRLPVFLSERDLGFDDGVFGLSARAMREGYVPFQDIFSSQGPLFLPLVWAADLLGLRGDNSPRLLAVAAGIVLAAAVYLIVRRTRTQTHAVVAAVLVALAGSVIRVTGPLLADGVALALAVLALALAVVYTDQPSRRRAIATGVVAAAAVAVKLLVAPVGLAIAACFLAKERRVHLGWAVGAAVVTSVVAWVPFGLGEVVEQSVRYHQDAKAKGDVTDNATEVITVLREQDPTVLVVVGLCLAVAAVQVVLTLRRRRGAPVGDRIGLQVGIWAWLLGTVGFLLLQPTLWRHHVAIVVPPLVLGAVLLVRRPAVLGAVGLIALLALPAQVDDVEPILAPEPYDADQQGAIDRMAQLPEGAWVVNDAPGLVWAAGLSAPPDLVDPSVKRIEQDLITLDSLRESVQDPRVCGVLAWRPKFAWLVPGLPAMLEEEGFDEVHEFGLITNQTAEDEGIDVEAGVNTDRETLWVRPTCDPSAEAPPG